MSKKTLFHKFILTFLLFVFSLGVKAQLTVKEIVDLQTKSENDRRLNEVIEYGKLAIQNYKMGNNDTILWVAFDKGGNAAVESRRFIDALEFYLASIEFGEKYHISRSKSLGLNNIGGIYESFEDYERARYYFNKAYEEALDNNDHYMMAASLINLVNIESILGEVNNAKKNLNLLSNLSLHTPQETSYWKKLTEVSIALAEKDFEKALLFSKQTRDSAIYYQFSDALIALPVERIAKAFLGLNELDSTLYYNSLIINHNRSSESFPDLVINAYKSNEEVYRLRNKSDSVNKYKLLALHLSDSLYNRRNFNAATDLLIRYEDSEIRSQIYYLNDKIHLRNIWIIISVCAVGIILAVLITIQANNRRLKKANELLIEKNRDLHSQSIENHKLREQLANLYENSDKGEEESIEEKEDHSGSMSLSEQQYMILLRNINRVMEDVTKISDPNFSLTQLAQLVNSNTSYVSMAINTTYRKNFKTYLNEYRIQLAAERLLENKNHTIQSIAESVGFKSVSNFISAFKKIMGMNPSVFRKIST